MTIGEVAEHFGLPTHVLRHWESEGLLAADRDGNGRRSYTRDDLFRIAAIVRAKEASLPLPEIRAFMAAGDQAARKEVLRRHQHVLQAKMAALRSALDLVETGLNCTHQDIAICQSFRAHLAELVDIPNATETAQPQDP
ncbi:DNA-binding transcriptional MerR regulator [Tamaricihabitans halophyticus]|uniref:DNA-binding transcriptional MerR regulator n=2 Tax=Tamaricihabitans halophyticus TaxID=1262583 RepID=A0A4R2QVF7_9PSEU|nr:DNA-binding transcriptional MerR regulator [Tamaricihabitans halophyticus]